MALQGEMTLTNGIALPSAYLKIERVVDDRSVHTEHHISIESSIFASADARQAGKDPAATALHTCPSRQIDPESGEESSNPVYAAFFSLDALDQAGANAIANGYRFLKTLSEYASMIDC